MKVALNGWWGVSQEKQFYLNTDAFCNCARIDSVASQALRTSLLQYRSERCRSQVPEHEILKIVRMYAPIITDFFDNEEEMAKFQKWREEQAQKEGEKTNKAKSA